MATRSDGGEPVVIALDVGGTTIDGTAVGLDGALAAPVQRFPSPEGTDAVQVIERLAAILRGLRRSAVQGGLRPVAAGLGMPGPFDYPRGVSLMEHKFAAVRGLDLRTPLEAAVELPVHFCNDAVAFALAAWWHEQRADTRLIGVTIGTGLGSGFVVAGRAVGEQQGAPASGEVWDVPFRGGILEDHVSRRAVERSYARASGAQLEVRQIADRARGGDATALQAFTRLGEALGAGLGLAAAAFRPTIVVCAGQIARAFDLFGSQAQAAYASTTAVDVPFTGASRPDLALLGIARRVAEDLPATP